MSKKKKQEEQVKLFFYGTRTVQYKGKDLTRRVTVGGILSEDGSTIKLGSAMCSEKDNFCKKKGRNIAISRAILHTEAVIEPENDRTLAHQFIEKAKELVD